MLSRAGGTLTWEPRSNQKPSHQLLKAELPIIRRKRDTVKRERKYPARGRGGPTGAGCWGRRRLSSLQPSPDGKFQTCRKRPPPALGTSLQADGTLLHGGPLNPNRGTCPPGWRADPNCQLLENHHTLRGATRHSLETNRLTFIGGATSEACCAAELGLCTELIAEQGGGYGDRGWATLPLTQSP